MELEKLFYLQGVGDSFIDCDGAVRVFSPAERLALLAAAMGRRSAPDPQAIEARVHELDVMPWHSRLAPLQWCPQDTPAIECQFSETELALAGEDAILSVSLKALRTVNPTPAEDLCFSLVLAQGEPVGDYLYGDCRYLRLKFPLHAALSAGEYRLSLRLSQPGAEGAQPEADTASEGELLLVPARAYRGPLAQNNQSTQPNQSSQRSKGVRPWGLGISLFYLRSQRQWGMGDFGDLNRLIDLAADSGCDFITLTPVHAPSLAKPSLASPYSPWDRRLLNPLYLAIDLVPEFAQFSREFGSGEWQRERLVLNQLSEIDYPRLALLKYRALARLFFAFEGRDELDGRRLRFDAFCKDAAEPLAHFCGRELAQARGLQRQQSWADDTVLIDALGRERFFAWLQFLCDEQLQQCQLRCRQAGMSIGLVRDLAVGALGEGSEVQCGDLKGNEATGRSDFCLKADIGAPPDPFAAEGQNWGMPPLDPVALRQNGFAAFRRLCLANMRHCGALRIDHVMALGRVWCWSKDLDGAQPSLPEVTKRPLLGCYLHYPADTLLAILTLESHLSRCIPIGEDLGTVPQGFRQQLQRLGILGNELIYFCRQGDDFVPPASHRRSALFQLGNQDVPPFIGWWRGTDLAQLAVAGKQVSVQTHEQRARDKQALRMALITEGLLSAQQPEQDDTHQDETRVFHALLAWCAASRSRLLGVGLWDLALESKPINIPGTHREYPNWRARMASSLDSLWQSAAFLQRLALVQRGRQLPAGQFANPASTGSETPARAPSLSPQIP